MCFRLGPNCPSCSITKIPVVLVDLIVQDTIRRSHTKTICTAINYFYLSVEKSCCNRRCERELTTQRTGKYNGIYRSCIGIYDKGRPCRSSGVP